MKSKYIVNFNTSENREERSAIMIGENEKEIACTLSEEFAELGQELRIISIHLEEKTKDFFLDF